MYKKKKNEWFLLSFFNLDIGGVEFMFVGMDGDWAEKERWGLGIVFYNLGVTV